MLERKEAKLAKLAKLDFLKLKVTWYDNYYTYVVKKMSYAISS